MVTVRQYIPWGPMVLMSGWLLLVPFPISSTVLRLMVTDGCGQVLQSETLQTMNILSRVLQGSLIAALFVEILFPRASWSAWVLASLPIASFLMASGAIALPNADFLTRCDVLFLRPMTTLQVNILSVVVLGAISIKRLRQWGLSPA